MKGEAVMKENMRKRLAVFLCILFVLPAIMAVMPQTAQEVQAANVSMYWNGTMSTTQGKVTVEQGAKFYVGDHLVVYDGLVKTGSMVKASYSSSKKSVASVNGKGYVEAKSTGTAKITVKYKGKSQTCTLKVVKAGSFGKKDAYTKLADAAETVAKGIPSKITTSNGFGLLKKKNDYQSVANSVTEEITSDGFIKEKKSSAGYSSSTEKLAVPKAGRFYRLCEELNVYAAKNSPLATRSAKVAKIASASANTQKVTIKLKKAIGKEQMLAMKINFSGYPEENLKAGSNKVYFYMSLINKNKLSDTYTALACMTKGSKTITVTPQKYSAGKGKFVNAKLKKGATYSLGGKADWTKGKTVKVK